MITDMFKEEGGKLFDSRSASLGHTLQGGIPSPLDRARAVRLALKCMSFIEEKHSLLLKQAQKPRQAGPEMAAVITIQGSSLEWVPVQDMLAYADEKNRRGINEPWKKMVPLVEALVARPQILGDKDKQPKSFTA
jgi:6-phosphofructokinase 1